MGVGFEWGAGCNVPVARYSNTMISEMHVLAQYLPGGGYGHGFLGVSPIYWLIFITSMLASLGVSAMMKHRFRQYSEIPMPLTGAQVAELMLRQNGITDVQVVSVPGDLTDHYDPTTKTVNLSEGVFASNSVASAAVAAHECGHAVQHQQAYAWLGFRTKMVPAVNLASNMLNMLMIAGFLGLRFFHSPIMLWLWVAFFTVTTLFAFVTLPVEFDASRRALAWIDRSGLGARMEHENARKALFWAAMTYVVAALGSLAQLLYYVSLLLGGQRRD